MQVILEVLGTLTATMTVVDTKDLQFRPLIGRYPWNFLGRLDHVEDDRDTVFVGLSDDSDVCVSSESFD